MSHFDPADCAFCCVGAGRRMPNGASASCPLHGASTGSLGDRMKGHGQATPGSLHRRARYCPPITRTYELGFFDQFTPESAYWAGFLAADGCVRSNRATVSIRLAVTDIDHVEKFRRAVRFNGEVKTSGSAAYLHVNGPRWVAALARNFNVTPRKTMTYGLPALPPDALPHFARGLIDGDGSITRTTVPSLHIAGTRPLLSDLAEVFFERCDVRLKSKNRVPPVSLHPNGITGQVSWSGKNAAKILRWIYADSTDELRLGRKYNRWRALWPTEAGAEAVPAMPGLRQAVPA